MHGLHHAKAGYEFLRLTDRDNVSFQINHITVIIGCSDQKVQDLVDGGGLIAECDFVDVAQDTSGVSTVAASIAQRWDRYRDVCDIVDVSYRLSSGSRSETRFRGQLAESADEEGLIP